MGDGVCNRNLDANYFDMGKRVRIPPVGQPEALEYDNDNNMGAREMSNGEEYVLEELDSAINHMEELKPDYKHCGLGEDFPRAMQIGTTVLLKAARIQQRNAVEAKKGRTIQLPFKVGGVGTVVAGVAYAILKAHDIVP